MQSFKTTFVQHTATDVEFEESFQKIESVEWEELSTFGDIITAARQLGLFGILVPKEYGGGGFNLRQFCDMCIAFESFDTTSSHSVGYFNTLGLLPLLFAHKLDFNDYVRRIASGQLLCSFALTEIQGGSHMRGMNVMATKCNGTWVLNGFKANIAHAQDAGLFLVCAQDESKKFRIFIVPKAENVQITRSVHPQYMNRIYINNISFDSVVVPDDHVIEDEKPVYDAMMCTRVVILAGKIGHLERCLRLLNNWVSTRVISTGLMKDDIYVKRTIDKIKLYHRLLTVVLDVSCRLDEEEGEDALGVPYDLAMVAKLTSVECAIDASFCTQALFGAKGIAQDSVLPRAMDDVRNWKVMEGSSEPMQHFLAVNFLRQKGWMAALVKEFPLCFAEVSQNVPRNPLASDLVSFGYVICWSVAKAICQKEGKLDASLKWIIDGKIQQGVHYLQGPFGQSNRFIGDDILSV